MISKLLLFVILGMNQISLLEQTSNYFFFMTVFLTFGI